MTHNEMVAFMQRDAATIIQLERQLQKLIRAAEFHLEGHDRSREFLQDALDTAKAHLE
jgi:hypothetical protein